jgi:hypothetical protein
MYANLASTVNDTLPPIDGAGTMEIAVVVFVL